MIQKVLLFHKIVHRIHLSVPHLASPKIPGGQEIGEHIVAVGGADQLLDGQIGRAHV